MQFLSKGWWAEARALGETAIAVTATMTAQLTISAVETFAAARLGSAVLAGITLALSLHLLAFLFTLGVVTAVTPLAAQAYGRGDEDEACRLGQQGLLVGLAFSIPAALLLLSIGATLVLPSDAGPEAKAAGQYLLGAAWGLPAWVCYVAVRSLAIAIGRVQVTTAIMVGAVPVHAVLTWYLVFGSWGMPALGAFGAGLAYALAAMAAWALLVAIDRFAADGALGHTLRGPIRWDASRVQAIVHLGLPLACRIVLREGVLPAAALALTPFGAAVVASHAVAARVLDVLGACCFGFSDAANARVGAAIGAEARHRIGFIGQVAVQLSLGVGGLFAIAIMAAPATVATLILGPANTEGVTAATALLPLAALLLVLESVQSAIGGALSGMRDAKGPLVIALTSTWGLGLPVGLGLAWMTGAPAVGMWCGLILGGCVTTVLYAIRFRRKLLP